MVYAEIDFICFYSYFVTLTQICGKLIVADILKSMITRGKELAVISNLTLVSAELRFWYFGKKANNSDINKASAEHNGTEYAKA